MPGPLRIGIKLSPQHVTWSALEESWQAAGASPAFDSMWTFDHLYPIRGEGPCFEGWTTLAVLAHHARGKTVGHLVLAATYRHAGLLAKMATAMDHATGGRFVLGLGAGWHEPETTAFALPLPPPGPRMRHLEAVLRVCRPLLHGTGSGAPVDDVDVEAPPLGLRGARNDPGPWAPSVPIWIGTEGERIGLRLVAEHADGWNHSAAREQDPAAFGRRRDVLLRHCAAAGRDPVEIEVSVQLPVGGDRAARRLALEQARAFVSAGCEHLVLMVDPNSGPAGVDAVASEVAGELR